MLGFFSLPLLDSFASALCADNGPARSSPRRQCSSALHLDYSSPPGNKKETIPNGMVSFWAPLVGLEPTVISRTIQLKIIHCYYERLRCPTKSSGLRISSILSTAAHKATPLLLPQAAGHCFGYLLRYAQSVMQRIGDRRSLMQMHQ